MSSALAALTSFGAALPAHASLSIHGSICKAYNNTLADYQNIFSGSTGTANHDQHSARSVICPVTREVNGNGVTVWVQGSVSQGESMSCTLESRDGNYLASKSVTLTAAAFDHGLSLTSAQALTWAELSLICTLPPKGRGRINALSVSG